MRAKKKRAIGLSIGQAKIAIAEANVDADGAAHIGFAEVADMPEGAAENGRIADPGAVSSAIRALLSAGKIDSVKSISLAIPNEGSVTRLQSLPSMSRNETLEALRGEVENYAVLAGGEPVIDFHITKGSPSDVGQQMEVLYVATIEELVGSYLVTMEAANLKASAIETRPLAIIRSFTNLMGQLSEDGLPEPGSDVPMAFVVIEENAGIIIIARRGNIEFIHDIEIGSGELQSDRAVRELSREIRSSVEFYENTLSSEEKIEHVILFSDNESLTDIAEKIKDALRVAIYAYGLSEFAAAGAALREVVKGSEAAVNLLLTSRGAEAVSMRKRVVMLLVVSLTPVFLAFGASFLLGMQADSVESELHPPQEGQAISEGQVISEAQSLRDIPILQSGVQSLKAQVDVTNAAMNSITWGDQAKLMEEIRSVTPKGVWLINLRWSGSTLGFEGFGRTWQDVYDFRTALLDYSPYFDPVEIKYIRDTEINEREVARFHIDCGVKKGMLGREMKQQ